MDVPSPILRSVSKDILNSRQGLQLARLFSRIIPASVGHLLAHWLADLVSSRRDWEQVKAVRCNQWVVHGEKLTKAELDLVVREAFRNIAHSIFDLYHIIDDPRAIDRLVEFSPAVQSIIDQSQAGQSGKVLVSLHLGNFDLALYAATLRGLHGMVLSLPPTEGGYTVQYEIRKKAGIDVVPIEMNALRQAVARLQAGGTVITAADWPVPGSKYAPSFLGRPSAAPVHHAYLALKARVPVVELVMLRQMNGKYHFLVSEPLTMQEYRDKQEGLIRNAEMVLKVAEEFLHQAPQQWAMSRPVWPELMDQVP